MDTVFEPYRRSGGTSADFNKVDAAARRLFSEHEGRPTERPIAHAVSDNMLLNVVLGKEVLGRGFPLKADTSDEERAEAALYYARQMIKHQSASFELQVSALELASEHSPREVKTLAQKALLNYRGYRRHLQKEPKAPASLNMSKEQLLRMAEQSPRRLQGGEEPKVPANLSISKEQLQWMAEQNRQRLRWGKENRFEERLAALAHAKE